jgi:hypothetical protein
MLKFDDVKNCKDIAELNEFIGRYLDERDLQGEERKSAYWALFYAWKESISREDIL